ncbi:MAG: sel1 repeat family protein [Candidatus Methanomethylophilaceae archaeon]|nr:sel1 repeat family protein [Candidatus Methanomethylophilaceae archaeon]MBR6038002.1 sel1 repeat family protein [Candidatus Methanomethylophilaceae archaeon]MBR6871438.1 sel1 repeat family protein [Candidatus Methanomethylophilaceae archaeon]
MRRAESAKVRWAGIELVEVLWETGTPDALREMASIALRLSDRRDHRAEGYMGMAYRYGRGVQKDLDKAESMLRRSSSGGVDWASDQLMEVLWEKGSYEESVRMASGRGSASANSVLGRAFRDGKGAGKDLQKAAEYLRKAGLTGELVEVLWDIGSPGSLSELASSAYLEIGKGNAFAAECLGLLHLEGTVVAHDERKALDLLEKAANLGSKSAAEKLMLMSMESNDADRTVVAASALLDENDAAAVEIVSEAYAEGKGLPRDKEMASIWTLS